MTGPGIKLLFFSDAAPPDPAEAGRDPRLCETHPFTRLSPRSVRRPALVPVGGIR